jgi:hypothetical protein
MNREWKRTNLSAVGVLFKCRQVVREICLEATMVAFVDCGRHPLKVSTSDMATPAVRDPLYQYNDNQAGRGREAKILGFRLQIRIVLTNNTLL